MPKNIAFKANALVTLVAGLLLAVPAWLGLFVSGVPTLITPFPVITSLPALLMVYRTNGHGIILHSVLIIPILLFFVWNPRLFSGGSKAPMRTVILLAICTVLTLYWFAADWSFAFRYHSGGYVHGVLVVNAVWLIILWVIWIRGLPSSSFYGNLLWHWALFAWLSWYAFPYLGELP
jgi:hypothetical protein